MKVKEIEFGVTVNLGNNESSKLSLRVELEDWEDYKQSLAILQKEVIELSGAKPRLIESLPTYENSRKVALEIENAQQLYREKRKLLDDLISHIRTLEERVTVAEKLIDKLDYHDCRNTTIEELVKMIESIKNLKGYQNKLRDQVDEKTGYDSDDSSML